MEGIAAYEGTGGGARGGASLAVKIERHGPKLSATLWSGSRVERLGGGLASPGAARTRAPEPWSAPHVILKLVEACPFCPPDSTRVIAIRPRTTALLARDAVHPGQALVVPRRHVPRVIGLERHELAELMTLARDTAEALQRAFGYESYNLIMNDGISAGQTVDHVHLHVVPRVDGDVPNARFWLSGALMSKLSQPSPAEQDAIKRRIRAQTDPAQHSFIDESVVIGHPTAEQLQDPEAPRRGTQIGEGVIIRSGSIIYDGVRIGDDVDIAHGVLIRERSRIGRGSYLLPGTQVHADVQVGERVRLQGFIGNRSVIHSDAVCLGSLVHRYESRVRGEIEASPVVCSGALVGVGAIVVGGVTVGANAVVGAGAVVTRSVAPGEVVVGAPATRRTRHV